MEAQAQQYKLEGFSHMLDARGATAAAYHLPRNWNFQLVVIDGAGKIAYSGGSAFSYEDKPTIHAEQIEKSIKNYPEDSETLRAGEADQRRSRAGQIQALADEQPVQAYREARFFVEAFPKSDDIVAVGAIADKLIAIPKVKQEIDAETEYQRTVAPEMKKASNQTELENLKPLVDTFMKSFGETDYGVWVKNAVADRLIVLTTEPKAGATPPPKERRNRGGL